ncbi:MAG: ABC transporter permease subunit [Dehalococcoidia bacterium]|nr:MAG: ABC transporter permease subunit [Dehalococcoidia bacterium]
MDLIFDALREAVRLLRTGDGDVYSITARTALITGASTLVASLIGLPIGLGIALGRFPGQRVLLAIANAGTGLPPVVAGLFVAILLWRSGPLGSLGLIYTPWAMIIAQALIATPLVVSFAAAGVMSLPPSLHLQVRAMGAGTGQYVWLMAREARLALLVAVMAGFGGVVSEVGAATMVGGNLSGSTRVLTTAAVLEVNRGNFGTALALGLILLVLVVLVSAVLTSVQARVRRR